MKSVREGENGAHGWPESQRRGVSETARTAARVARNESAKLWSAARAGYRSGE
jgi:hypothetical protein